MLRNEGKVAEEGKEAAAEGKGAEDTGRKEEGKHDEGEVRDGKSEGKEVESLGCVEIDSSARLGSLVLESFLVAYSDEIAAECLAYVREGASLTVTDTFGDTALHLALKHGFVETFKGILTINLTEQGRTGIALALNTKNRDGNTPLMLAIIKKDLRSYKEILHYAAANPGVIDFNLTNNKGLTALMLVVRDKDFSLALLTDLLSLLDKKQLNFTNASTEGKSAAHLAAIHNKDKLHLLIDTGKLDVECKTSTGVTLLMYAAKFCSIKTALLLLGQVPDERKDAYNDAVDSNGKNAVMYLLEGGSEVGDLLRILLSAENINEQDIRGNTALIYAAANDNASAVRHLLGVGAYVSLTNKAGHDALSMAALKGKVLAAQAILDSATELTAAMLRKAIKVADNEKERLSRNRAGSELELSLRGACVRKNSEKIEAVNNIKGKLVEALREKFVSDTDVKRLSFTDARPKVVATGVVAGAGAASAPAARLRRRASECSPLLRQALTRTALEAVTRGSDASIGAGVTTKPGKK